MEDSKTKNILAKKNSPKITFSLLVVAIILILLGIGFGNPRSVWQKAVFICMECIGLG
jgi:hypothetical protein